MKINKTPEIDEECIQNALFPPQDVIEVLEQKELLNFDLVTYDKDVANSKFLISSLHTLYFR